MTTGMFLFCVTAQCLTPICDMRDAHIAAGTITLMLKADSEQDAIREAAKAIAAEFEKDKDLTAIHDPKSRTLCVMDEDGHIVNHFWNFRCHRV